MRYLIDFIFEMRSFFEYILYSFALWITFLTLIKELVMRTQRARYTGQLTLRIGAEVERAIALSGERGSDWLREAARLRLEQEQQKETPLKRVENRLKGLQLHVDELAKKVQTLTAEVGKSRIDLVYLKADAATILQDHHAIYQLQRDASAFLKQMDRNWVHAADRLGPNLLVVLSQQLRDLIRAENEKERWARLPIPPRQGL